jgi:hypothetical protein
VVLDHLESLERWFGHQWSKRVGKVRAVDEQHGLAGSADVVLQFDLIDRGSLHGSALRSESLAARLGPSGTTCASFDVAARRRA